MDQIPDPDENLKTMSFGDHLEELRSRLLRSLFVVFFFAVVAFIYQDILMEVVTGPHRVALSQIEARRTVLKIEDEVESGFQALQGVPAQTAAQVLLAVDRQQDWWSRWETLRQQQNDTGPVTDLIELLQERITEFERGNGPSSSLHGTVNRLQNSADHLKIVVKDAPWGSQTPLENSIEQLTTMVQLWNGWNESAAIKPPAPQNPESESDSSEKAPVESVEPQQVATALEQVAGLSVSIEDHSRGLIGWRGQALPLALLSYSEAFFAYVKLSLLFGLLCALPWFTFEIWQFVSAGLYQTERRTARPFLPVAFLLLSAGVCFAYMVLIPVGLSFLGSYGDPQLVRAVYTLKDYLGLFFTLVLGMGLIFQLPLLMVFLTRSGLVEVDVFRRYRRYSITGAVVLGALLTPPDIVTQLLMAGPLVILYELGILSSSILHKRAQEQG